jgi:hypothetical protein
MGNGVLNEALNESHSQFGTNESHKQFGTNESHKQFGTKTGKKSVTGVPATKSQCECGMAVSAAQNWVRCWACHLSLDAVLPGT